MIGRSVAAGALLGLLLTFPVDASHTVPAPRSWWDLKDNLNADTTDGDIGYARVGSEWTVEKITDLDCITSSWRGLTHWDVFNATDHGGTARASIRVDGVSPCGAWGATDAAATCIVKTARKDGTIVDFYDISDIDTGINSDNMNYNFGFDDPIDTPQWKEYDFRGVGVHELGHGIFLLDATSCQNPVISMCGNVDAGIPSRDLRSLQSDDIVSANNVYP